MPKTAIIILTYNNLAYNKGVVASIKKYTKPETYELIMVDNGSTDGTKEWLEAEDGIKVVLNKENVGFPKGCNIGIAHADVENDILLLNNDIEVCHNWLDNLQTALHSDPKIGAVGGLDANHFRGALDEAGQHLNFAATDTSAIHQFAIKNNQLDPSRWRYTNFLTGYCMLIKRNVLNQIGLLDERFSPGNFEDDDLSFRILAAGYYLLQCHDCFIHHFGSQSFRKDEVTYWKLIDTNSKKFSDKWHFHAWDKSLQDHNLLRLLEADSADEIHVLHVGCHLGNTLFEIKNRYPHAHLYGVDTEGKYTDVIKNIITTHPTLAAFEKQLFDFILIGEFFEQLDHPRQFLIQAKEHLKPNGQLIVNIQNIMHYSVLRKLLNGHWQYGEQMALNKDNRIFLTANDIKTLFNDCGYINPLIFHWYLPTTTEEDAFIKNLCAIAGEDKAHLYRTSLYTVRFQNDPQFKNPQKICFISCVNNETHYQLALHHMNQLEIPEGFEIEHLAIPDAKSMSEGYNRAMKQTDAKYKVYLHQDVSIINKRFIFDMLEVFNQDEQIGLMGVCGVKKMPKNGIWWESNERYGQVIDSHTGVMSLLEFQAVTEKIERVEALDGLILMTQHDINWREDLFNGFHFYDASQCMEFARAGYLVVVPAQKSPWVVHDCGRKPNWQEAYERYRQLFLIEYKEEVQPSET